MREIAGPATHDIARWPMTIGRETNIDTPIAPLPTDRAFTAVAIPNPHLIAFVDEIDEAELVAVGRACEAAPGWLPNRANVSFVETRGAATLFVRTFERGVGLTDSCGSAMAASVHAAGLTGRIAFGTEVTVLNRGGLVRGDGGIGWHGHGRGQCDVAMGGVDRGRSGDRDGPRPADRPRLRRRDRRLGRGDEPPDDPSGTLRPRDNTLNSLK